MRIHAKDKINKLIALRKKGHSINELVGIFQIPKTTVWHHVHKIKILPQYKKILDAKQGGSKKRKERAIATAKDQAKILLSPDNKNKYACSLIAMLYWAEGNKESLVFTNTDPKMIALFIRIVEKVFEVSPENIGLTIRYFTGMSRKRCFTYWNNKIGFSNRTIKMYYNDGGNRGKSPFGICRVTVKKGGFLLKIIQSLIDQIKPW